LPLIADPAKETNPRPQSGTGHARKTSVMLAAGLAREGIDPKPFVAGPPGIVMELP
jgi:hypothetical protein